MGRVVLVPRNNFVLVLVVTSGFARVPFLHKFLQLPFSNELLYLLLQVSAIFCIMVVILVEMALLLLVTHIR